MSNPSQTQSRFDRILLRIGTVLAFASALALMIIMMVSVIDVGGRYLFIRPLPGAKELVSMLLIISTAWAFGYTQLLNAHIRIELLTSRLPRRGRAMADVFGYLLGAIAAALITWQGALRTWEYIHRTRGHITEILNIPNWPFMLILVIGFASFCMIFVRDVIIAIREVIKR
jgi:TRAP-type C4-dicarboxylate transport system permease small subunit